jgi:hypothetical protein
MLTRKILVDKLNKKDKICIVTACLLPTKAVEILTNYQELEGKKEYLLNAYDENLCLKNMKEIRLLDCIVISKGDLIEN